MLQSESNSYDFYRKSLAHQVVLGHRNGGTDPDRIRKPDVSFIRLERMAPEDCPEGHCEIVPDLVAEVVSPNDKYYEVRAKTEEYLQAGVKLVWVVDPSTRSVQVHRADGSTDELHENQELSGEDVVPGFQLRVAE